MSARNGFAGYASCLVLFASACNTDLVIGLKPPSTGSNMQTIVVWGDYDPTFPDGLWMQSRDGSAFGAIPEWTFGTGGGEYGGFLCDWQCANSTNENIVPPVAVESACNPIDPNCQIPPTHADSLFFSTVSKYYVDPSTMADTAMANACRLMEARVAQMWATGEIFRGNPDLADNSAGPMATHAGATPPIKFVSYPSMHIDGRYLDLAESDSAGWWYGPLVTASMLHEAAHNGLGPSPRKVYNHPHGFDQNGEYSDYPFNYSPNNGREGCVKAPSRPA